MASLLGGTFLGSLFGWTTNSLFQSRSITDMKKHMRELEQRLIHADSDISKINQAHIQYAKTNALLLGTLDKEIMENREFIRDLECATSASDVRTKLTHEFAAIQNSLMQDYLLLKGNNLPSLYQQQMERLVSNLDPMEEEIRMVFGEIKIVDILMMSLGDADEKGDKTSKREEMIIFEIEVTLKRFSILVDLNIFHVYHVPFKFSETYFDGALGGVYGKKGASLMDLTQCPKKDHRFQCERLRNVGQSQCVTELLDNLRFPKDHKTLNCANVHKIQKPLFECPFVEDAGSHSLFVCVSKGAKGRIIINEKHRGMHQIVELEDKCEFIELAGKSITVQCGDTQIYQNDLKHHSVTTFSRVQI